MQDPLIPEPPLVRPAPLVEAGPNLLVPATSPTVLPAGGSAESAATSILRGLAHRWRWVVGIGFLAALVVGGVVWAVIPPPVPTATARLLIPQKPQTHFASEHPDPPMERSTLAALVKSQLVLNAALRDTKVSGTPLLRSQEDPIDFLSKRIMVDFLDGPEILRISLANDDPEQAKVIVNAVKEAFVHEIIDRSRLERATRLRRLEEFTGTVEESLNRLRVSVRSQQEQFGGDDKAQAQQQLNILKQVDAANSELLKLQSKIRHNELEENSLKARAGGAVVEQPKEVLDKYVEDDPRVREFEAIRIGYENQLKALAERASDPSKTLSGKELQTRLDEHKKTNAGLRDTVRKEWQDRYKLQSSSETSGKLSAIRQEIAFQKDLEKILKDEVGRLTAQVQQNRVGAIDLAPKQLQIRNQEALLTRLQGVTDTLKLEQDTPARVLRLEDALVTRVDAEKRRMVMAMGGAAAALAAVLAVIGFVEFRMRRVHSPDAVSNNLGLRVVGTIPKPPFTWKGRVSVDDEIYERLTSESIACTRTMLLHADGLAPHRVIQITSPVSGEGKTTFSTSLARNVAQSGRKTLLVDGDLRNPSAHVKFDLPVGPGLCEVLRGEVSIQDVMRETPVAGLTMITAGEWKDETAMALVSSELEGLYALWRNQFDLVIVDSSPVLPVTDPLLLARHADGVIVALMQGVSRMPLANEAYKRMAALGVRVLGVVLNGTAMRGYGYTGSYFPKT